MQLSLFIEDPREGSVQRTNEPVTVGVPLPRGETANPDMWRLEAADGRPLPLQARALDRWPDGSIRWALLDFLATTDRGPSQPLTLRLNGRAPTPGETVWVRAAADGLIVETAGTAFVLSGSAPLFFASIRAAGKSLIEPNACLLRLTTAADEACQVRWLPPVVEEQGVVRVTVRFDGEVRDRGIRLDLRARLHFYAASRVVRLQLTVRNPRAASHPGGFWELGDAGSVLLKEMALVLVRSWASPLQHVSCRVVPGEPVRKAERHVEVYQESSGGENWDSTNHVNRDGAVSHRFRGYWADIDGDVTGGLRATPIVVLEGGADEVGAVMPGFWQNFPRAIEAAPDSVTVSVFPRQYAALHELQGGEQKTHDIYLMFGRDRVTPLPLDWCCDRLIVHPSPEWYAESNAVPYLTPRIGADDDAGAAARSHRAYETLVEAAIEGRDTFAAKRERADEYGWRHFGDIYADHVAASAAAGDLLVAHLNNECDPLAGFAVQFMRSGEPRWHRLATELAAHVVDVDIYHTDQDTWAYNHGLFRPTLARVGAGRATHRCHRRGEGARAGGPAAEHNYTTGLMLHYFMTGEPAAREAALDLARFVLDADDGGKTALRWLAGGPTGLATVTGAAGDHGPGAGSGNSLNAMIDGHRLAADRRFLEKAEEIIRRSAHPRQDLSALDLREDEARRSYTVFLGALGKYLDRKAELGALDDRYAFARETLLHYARWMADHEHPGPEPGTPGETDETRVALAMRACEAFDVAAKHAEGPERERFLERADHFFECAASTLSAMPGRTLARPVAVLLTHGWMHRYFQQNPFASAPAPAVVVTDWPPARPFVSQKARATRRAKLLVATATVLLASIAAALSFAWLRQ